MIVHYGMLNSYLGVKRINLLLLVLVLLTTNATASALIAPNLSFERIPTTDANKSILGGIRNMNEDSRGFIWVATNDRLLRYDGNSYRDYVDSPADPRNSCISKNNSIFLDASKQLWIATDKALCRYNTTKDYLEVFSLPFANNNTPPFSDMTAMREDAQHNLFIGTKAGIIILNAARDSAVYHQMPEQQDLLHSAAYVATLFIDSKQRIWVTTDLLGLLQFDPKTHQYSKVHLATATANYDKETIQSIAEDSNHNLWFGLYQKGVIVFNPDTGIREDVFDINKDDTGLSSTSVWGITRDSQNELWFVIDEGGLGHYNPTTKKIDRQHAQQENPYSLTSDKITVVLEDSHKNIWVATYPEGLHVLFYSNRSSENYRHSSIHPENTINNNGILSLLEDDDGNILIGTEKGLNIFNPKTTEISNLSDPNLPFSVPIKPITTIAKDEMGGYWVGTWGDGFYHVNFKKKEFTHYEKGENDGQLNSKIVWKFFIDGKKGVWIATEGGGINYLDNATQKFTAMMPIFGNDNSLSSKHYYSIQKDATGNYWFAGISSLDYYNPSAGEFKHFSSDKPSEKTIPSKRIRAVLIDKKNRVWVATENDGIYFQDSTTKKFQHLTKINGLPNMFVTALAEDTKGDIWASTMFGLARIDGNTLSIKRVSQSQGILASTINRGALTLSRDGYVYVGGTEGFSRFKPDAISVHNERYPVYITRLRVANEVVTAQTKNSILSQDISLSNNIELQYSDRMFSFEFSALSYHLSSWNHYAYSLEGFDKTWNYINTNNSATFTNIPPGNYVFRVKAANSDGVWNDDIRNLTIKILPPFWKTTWAYILYALIASLFAYFIHHYNTTRIELAKDKELNNKLLKLDEIKDAFLANTSHELRTPVNGIVGIAEALTYDSENLTNDQQEQLQLIISSGKRLSSLINDILDYAKMADQEIVLHKSMLNIDQIVTLAFTITSILTKHKKINLVNKVNPAAKLLYADANRMEQILINLISNAIKYSDEGEVKVTTDLIDNMFTIVVEDSGIGIADEDIAKLFTPFSQLEASANRRAGGTGLGLTVTRHLIECHQGTIKVTSKVGVGSSFIIAIPYTETQEQLLTNPHHEVESHRIAPANIKDKLVVSNSNALPELTQSSSPKDESNSEIKLLPKIIIADDDPINCMILQQLIKRGGYEVITTHDGLAALEKLTQVENIAVIILDIHMPKMGGFEAAEAIRKLPSRNKTPILFLTATITEADRQLAESFGHSSIQLKPIEKNLLYTTLSELQKDI